MAELLTGVPESVETVAVFVNESIAEIKRYVDAGISVVQLHGSESASTAREVAEFAVVWKAMAIQSADEIENYKEYPAQRYLLDAYCEDEHGGTGKLADWDLAELAVEHFKVPVLLAGGLKPDNVADAIAKVKPFGLDLSSGVEIRPGIKDHALIDAFMGAVADVLRT